MSNGVKDFAHYADAAESVIATIQDDMPTADVAVIAAIAQVFATLATGAPKAALPGVCPGRLFPVPPNGEFKICVLGTGHIGDHLTGNGVSFID